MRKKTGRVADIAVVFVILFVAFSLATAEDPKPPTAKSLTVTVPSPLELRKTGTVRVIKGASGEVTSINLIVTSYEITLDEGSKPLETMDGQKVKVIGTYKREGEKRLITVKSVEPAVDETKPAQAEAKPADKATEKPVEKPVEGAKEKSAEQPAAAPVK